MDAAEWKYARIARDSKNEAHRALTVGDQDNQIIIIIIIKHCLDHHHCLEKKIYTKAVSLARDLHFVLSI